MSGRVVDSDRIKHGEIVAPDLMDLTENYGEDANAMRISSEYKNRRRMRKELAGEDTSSDEDEKPHRILKKETPGQSESLSKYLEKLPEREKRMMKYRESAFEGGGRRKRKVEMGKNTEGDSHMYPAKDALKLRKEVLGLSLFPNLYNKNTLLAGM